MSDAASPDAFALPRVALSADVTPPAGRGSLLGTSSVTEAAARAAASRGVAIFLRQSQYIDEHSGSRALQTDAALEHARLLGATRSETYHVTAWGERARDGAPRPKFESVRALIRQRLIGVLIVPEHHRLSRKLLDAELLFQEAIAAGVLLHIAGRMYNPAVPADLFILRTLASLAELDNQQRAGWGLASRLKKAEARALRLRLPTGLVWVAENDAEYFARARAAGLGAWLRDLPLRHATDVRAPGVKRDLAAAARADERAAAAGVEAEARALRARQYVLPFPDAEVVRAVALRLRWALEAGSADVAAARIRAGSDGWPAGRARRVPHLPCGSIYRAGTEAEWREFDPTHFRAWLRSPAWFGIYSVYMDALLPRGQRRHQPGRRKGLHFARARSRQEAGLPDAAALLAVAAITGPATGAATGAAAGPLAGPPKDPVAGRAG